MPLQKKRLNCDEADELTHLLVRPTDAAVRKPAKLARGFTGRIYWFHCGRNIFCSPHAELRFSLPTMDRLRMDRPSMSNRRRSRFSRRNPVAVALWVNALLLGGILVVLLGRSNSPSFFPAAFGQDQSHLPLAPQPIAGGAGLFLMPAQFATNIWGCYIMDVDRQTLCAYRYDPSEKQLLLVAARGFQYDRELKNFNTGNGNGEMSPGEVEKMVAAQKQDERVKAPPVPAPPAETPQKSE
jgi:hypothetical protein